MDAVIGLGSDLGDRRALLAQAALEIRKIGSGVVASSLYETSPIGPAQPMFLNAAIALSTELEPPGLLAALLAIEHGLGRVRGERWGPRTIDLDILWIAGLVHESATLVVPHPELRFRAFALRPLLDVAPGATDPRDGSAYRDVLAGLAASSAPKIVGAPSAWT